MTDESLRAKLMGISQSLENTPVGSPTSAASSGDGTNPAQWAGPVPGVSDKVSALAQSRLLLRWSSEWWTICISLRYGRDAHLLRDVHLLLTVCVVQSISLHSGVKFGLAWVRRGSSFTPRASICTCGG